MLSLDGEIYYGVVVPDMANLGSFPCGAGIAVVHADNADVCKQMRAEDKQTLEIEKINKRSFLPARVGQSRAQRPSKEIPGNSICKTCGLRRLPNRCPRALFSFKLQALIFVVY